MPQRNCAICASTPHPPPPARCPPAAERPGSGSGRQRRRRAPARRRASAPFAVTPSSRPPLVTSRPPSSAVPAWKTSAPLASASLDALDRRPAVTRRRVVARGQHDGDRRSLDTSERDSRQRPLGRAGEYGEEVAVDERHDRLRLRVAEAAVVLEHAGPLVREHQPGEQRPDERRSPARELRKDRPDGPVDDRRRASRRRALRRERTSPCHRCSARCLPRMRA